MNNFLLCLFNVQDMVSRTCQRVQCPLSRLAGSNGAKNRATYRQFANFATVKELDAEMLNADCCTLCASLDAVYSTLHSVNLITETD